MDLDYHNETSIFSLNDYEEEDILTDKCKEEETEKLLQKLSEFKSTDIASSENQSSPNSDDKSLGDKTIAPTLDKIEVSQNDSVDTDTDLSIFDEINRLETEPRPSTFKKSQFCNKLPKPEVEPGLSAVTTFLEENKDLLPIEEAKPKSPKKQSLFTKEKVDKVVNRKPTDPKIFNIVGTANLNCRFDPKTIALNARNTEYNPKRFDAAIMKIRHPKTTALIFSSGKIVVSGAKTESD